MYQYYPMMDGYTNGWGLVAAFLWLALLIVIVILVVRLLRAHHGGTPTERDPLDIAKERYARGEITKEQFEQLRKDLQ